MPKVPKMKKRCVGLCWVIWLWAACLPSAAAENQPPAEGGTLPAIRMPAPQDADHRSYLGLSGEKDFTVADISAEVVIIEIFSMY
jgi:hypothetical protein